LESRKGVYFDGSNTIAIKIGRVEFDTIWHDSWAQDGPNTCLDVFKMPITMTSIENKKQHLLRTSF